MELYFQKKEPREKQMLMLHKKRKFRNIHGNRGCHTASNMADCHSVFLCSNPENAHFI